jgi:hypothetical protein
MQTKSPASQNNHEHALGPELAEKGAQELQESFESAARGEDGDDDREDNANGDNGSDEDEDGECNDQRDRGGSAAMDVETPGVSTSLLQPMFLMLPSFSIAQSHLPRCG